MFRSVLFLLFSFLQLFLFADEGKVVHVYQGNGSEIAVNEEPRPPLDLPTQRYESSIFRVFLSLFGLIALVGISFWLFRRLLRARSSSTNSKSIEILERKPLSPKTMIYLVEVEGKKVLLAESHLDVKRLVHWSEEETQELEK